MVPGGDRGAGGVRTQTLGAHHLQELKPESTEVWDFDSVVTDNQFEEPLEEIWTPGAAAARDGVTCSAVTEKLDELDDLGYRKAKKDFAPRAGVIA